MIQLYDVAVFVHVLGIIALFGGFIVHHRAGARLRAASTVEEANSWFGLIDATKGMFPGGLLMLLVSGIYMMYLRWLSMPAFIVVGLVGWVLIMISGAVVAGKQSRAIKAALANTSGPLTAAQQLIIHDRTPWLTVAMLNGMALGAKRPDSITRAFYYYLHLPASIAPILKPIAHVLSAIPDVFATIATVLAPIPAVFNAIPTASVMSRVNTVFTPIATIFHAIAPVLRTIPIVLAPVANVFPAIPYLRRNTPG